MDVCLEDSFDTVIFFSPLYTPIPPQPGLAYLVRDACNSNDATDVIIPFPVLQGKTKDLTNVTFSFQFFQDVLLRVFLTCELFAQHAYGNPQQNEVREVLALLLGFVSLTNSCCAQIDLPRVLKAPYHV